MRHSAVAAHASEIAPAEPAAGGAPQWAQLLPVGAVNGRDGRRFRLSRPAALVEAFRRDPRPLPVDYEHASVAARTTGVAAPAAGWITDLKVAENALWGLIEWTDKARAMVAAREYRFLSPEFLYDAASGEVRALLSAGLVHHPNLALAALNRQEPAMPQDRNEDDDDDGGAPRVPAAVLEALRLPADADADAAVAAIEALRDAADPEKVVPVAAMRELLAERNAKADRLAEREADAKVEAALAAGHLTPAMRPWATALCRQDPASFDAFMTSAAPACSRLFKPAPAPARFATSAHAATSAARSDDAARIARQLGLDPRDLEGARAWFETRSKAARTAFQARRPPTSPRRRASGHWCVSRRLSRRRRRRCMTLRKRSLPPCALASRRPARSLRRCRMRPTITAPAGARPSPSTPSCAPSWRRDLGA